jgi:hypothetical protein
VGWVGLGISANGGMRGADIALLIQDNAGKLVVQDRWANATARPFMDSIQSKRLIDAETKQADGVTYFVFTRRWGACDAEDFPIVRQIPKIHSRARPISNLDRHFFFSFSNRKLELSGSFAPLAKHTILYTTELKIVVPFV